MEGFSVVDIYDTKGAEYLFVIAYLLVLILFWTLVRNPQKAFRQIRNAVSTLTSSLLRIPQGIFFNKNHTWTHLDQSGEAKVGVDDFLQRVIGEMQLKPLKEPGDIVNRGDMMAEIVKDNKSLKVYSPVSGEVVTKNVKLMEDPGLLKDDPYEKGWLYKFKPADWSTETKDFFLAEEASEWSEKELAKLKDFLSGAPMEKYGSEPSMVILQDGGEIRENVLSGYFPGIDE
ncbi:glycine cleavage system protein H [Bacteroidota bacterium]